MTSEMPLPPSVGTNSLREIWIQHDGRPGRASNQPRRLAGCVTPGAAQCRRATGSGALWRLLRHEEAGLFADAEVLPIAIRRVQRLVHQPHVPVVAVGNIDHVTPLALE